MRFRVSIILLQLFFASFSVAQPVLEQLLEKEKEAELAQGKAHILGSIRSIIRSGPASDAVRSERQKLQEIDQLGKDIAAAAQEIKAKTAELEAFEADTSNLPETTVQDEYAGAVEAYEKYREIIEMNDEERDELESFYAKKIEDLNYLELRLEQTEFDDEFVFLGAPRQIEEFTHTLQEARAEKAKYELWSRILEDEQRSIEHDRKRQAAGKGYDEFEEYSYPKLDREEQRADDEVFRNIDDFGDYGPKPGDLDYDYLNHKVKDEKRFAFLDTFLKNLDLLDRLKYARLHKKTKSEKELSPDELAEVERLREYYPNNRELAILVTTGTPSDYEEVERLMQNRREMAFIKNIFAKRIAIEKLIRANNEKLEHRAELKHFIAGGDKKIAKLSEKLHAAKIARNLFAYQSLTRAMTVVTQEILHQVTRQGKAAALQSKEVKELRGAFLTLMRRLETFELELAYEFRGARPYPGKPFKQSVKDVIQFFDFDILKFGTSDEQTSKKQLMREYHFALNGISGLPGAYVETLRSIKNAAWSGREGVKVLMDYLTTQGGVQLIKDIDQFAMDNPILAADLMRNLSHTYKILSQYHKTGLEAALADVRLVFEIKEAENIARDWLLGTEDYLYSEHNIAGEPLDPRILTFIDFAEKAPYFAGAIVGASGGGTIAGWAGALIEWVPVVGSYKPLKIIAKATGGIAQVHLQKYAASKISRKYELLASTLRRGFEAYSRGDNPKDIAVSLLKYNAMRKAIQVVGTLRRIQRTSGVQEVFARIGECFKESPSGAAGGGAVGFGAGIGAGVGAFTAGAAAGGPIALPFVGAAVCVGLGVAVVEVVKDAAVKGRKEARRLRNVERRLRAVQLPEFTNESMKLIASDIDLAASRIDTKELGKRAALEGLKSQEEVHGLYIRALQEHMAKIEEEHAERKLLNFEKVPDPGVDPLLEKLAELKDPGLGNKERRLRAREAMKLLGSPENFDPFEQRIYDKLLEFDNSVRKTEPNVRGPYLDAIEKEVKLLRIRQMEDNLVETNNELTKRNKEK